uniref:2,5-diketo-D-gluconic acid reductase B-like n=1 Tax=Styela clava TaxID=7725 RepID=UPI001939793C|nr:2,5-diketo-D-gluconic acid reductase B-like [Styela clava]
MNKIRLVLRVLILVFASNLYIVTGENNEEASVPEKLIPTIRLKSGYEMPVLGFGTGKLGHRTTNATRQAINMGYRLIDTAKSYIAIPSVPSEMVIGKLIEDSGIPREEFFIVTKILPEYFTEEECRKAIQESLKFLRTSYIDLVLIHTPEYFDENGISDTEGTYIDGWKSLEMLVDEGLIRSIGISNFFKEEIIKIQEIAKHPISVLQNWFDPYFQDRMLRMECQYMEIVYIGYSTLGGVWLEDGIKPNPILNDEVITKIAAEHNRSPAEVVLKWAMNQEVVVIPGSTKEEHLSNNLNSLNLELSEEETVQIVSLDGKLEPQYEDDVDYTPKSRDPIDFVREKITYLLSFVWPKVNTDVKSEL